VISVKIFLALKGSAHLKFWEHLADALRNTNGHLERTYHFVKKKYSANKN
jgi:hypothetical protein